MYIVSVKNLSAAKVSVLDLGFYVDIDDSQEIEGYNLSRLRSSTDLTTNLLNNKLAIVTSEGKELTGQAGVDVLSPITRSDFNIKGWKEVSNTPPSNPEAWDTWLNSTNATPYLYDPNRNLWISLYDFSVHLSKNWNADGKYLTTGTVTNSKSGYVPPRDCIITSIGGSISDGNNTKAFDVMINQSSVYNFALNNSLIYTKDNLSIPINAGDTLNMYVSKTGSAVKDPQFLLSLKWFIVPV